MLEVAVHQLTTTLIEQITVLGNNGPEEGANQEAAVVAVVVVVTVAALGRETEVTATLILDRTLINFCFVTKHILLTIRHVSHFSID